MPKFKVVFFDLGSTLIYSKTPGRRSMIRADRTLVETLQHAGIRLEIKSFFSEFETFLDSYYAGRGTGLTEKTTFSSVEGNIRAKWVSGYSSFRGTDSPGCHVRHHPGELVSRRGRPAHP